MLNLGNQICGPAKGHRRLSGGGIQHRPWGSVSWGCQTARTPIGSNGLGCVTHLKWWFESVQAAGLSGSACQQTRTCQRRKRRVWRVQRGQRTEPWWFSALPGWRRFQPENRAETQILANVWDNGRPQTAMASSKTGRREVMVLGFGSPSWTRFELLRPLRRWRSRRPSSRFNSLRPA